MRMIDREKALSFPLANGEYDHEHANEYFIIGCETYKEWLENLPVIEVVRCKDCRYHENEEIGMVYCPAVVGGWVEDNWFCKGGEKMDEVGE